MECHGEAKDFHLYSCKDLDGNRIKFHAFEVSLLKILGIYIFFMRLFQVY